MKKVYMDYAATTPVDPEVVDAMLPYYREKFGNPSSIHSLGRECREAIEKARGNVARLIGARESEIIFTSGGTESNNLAIKGIASVMREKRKEKGPHVITTVIEHRAVLEPCKDLEKEGFIVKYVGVDADGIVDPSEIEESISRGTFLITVMHANNEIGTIQPIEEICKIARENEVLFHTDAVQSAGKLEIDVGKLKPDLLSISSHKIYGPKGVGALYVKEGLTLDPMISGGGHERGIRSGTENVPGIVGFGKAAEICARNFPEEQRRIGRMRDMLIDGILSGVEKSHLNGHRTMRLPNNVNVRFDGIEGESLVLKLDGKGIAASTASACASHRREASHVLKAIGLTDIEARGSLRLTLGRWTSEEDVEYVLDVLPSCVKELREISSLWNV